MSDDPEFKFLLKFESVPPVFAVLIYLSCRNRKTTNQTNSIVLRFTAYILGSRRDMQKKFRIKSGCRAEHRLHKKTEYTTDMANMKGNSKDVRDSENKV